MADSLVVKIVTVDYHLALKGSRVLLAFRAIWELSPARAHVEKTGVLARLSVPAQIQEQQGVGLRDVLTWFRFVAPDPLCPSQVTGRILSQ